MVVVFAASKAVHGGSCFDMEHVQNATLAGGVAIGAACQYITNLGGAVGLGATAGLVSVAGFTHLGPRLKRAGLTDTCGIASLHWMPGLIGGFASAVAAVGADPVSNRTGYTQGGYQAAVTFISLGLGLSSGALRAPCCRAPPYACAATDGAPLRAPGALAGRVLRSPRFAEPMADNFYEARRSLSETLRATSTLALSAPRRPSHRSSQRAASPAPAPHTWSPLSSAPHA